MPLPPNLGPLENNHKPWREDQPFQRLNSPSFKAHQTLDGLGHRMGTRRGADFPNLAIAFKVSEGLRTVPAWVRTRDVPPGAAPHSLEAEQAAEHEIYGVLERSFQTWTDAPGFQWHHFYDWNLHVKPVAEFDWLRGSGNRVSIPHPDGLHQFVEGAIECEWDTGAFGKRPGSMFNIPDSNQQGVDWAWPMTGDWVWVAGRSIYDGGHEFDLKCRSELHPCKAVANVRREAFLFPEVGHHVPAVQFAFFASRLGGYVSFGSLAPSGDDYEFVVDLPLGPDEFAPVDYPVGATPDFPFNRLSLRRPAPLVHFNFEAHQTAKGNKLSPAELARDFKPEVEITIPKADRPLERQARIKIPLKKLAATHPKVDSYGVIISLGWEDPNKTQGKRVKRCLVNFTNLHPASLHGDTLSTDEWRFKACVNNRWFHWERSGIVSETNLLFKEVNFEHLLPGGPIEFFLDERDAIRVHSHGTDLNMLDDPYVDFNDELGQQDGRTVKFNRIQVFAEAIRVGEDPTTVLPGDPLLDVAALGLPLAVLEDIESIPVIGDIVGLLGLLLAALPVTRKLTPNQLLGILGQRAAIWNEHIDMQPPRESGAHVVQRVVARNAVNMLASTFKDGNRPLGMCDPGHGFPGEENPLLVTGRNDARPVPITLMALLLDENEQLAELFEPDRVGDPSTYQRAQPNRNKVNYELTYTVQVTPQFPAGSTS